MYTFVRVPCGLVVPLVIVALCQIVAAEEKAATRRPVIDTNSVAMPLVYIPAGEFLMGGNESAEEVCAAFASHNRKPEEFSDEFPRHPVQITRPFWLGQCEVTVGQFRRFTEAAKYKTLAESDGEGGWGYDPATGTCSGRQVKFNWRNPGFPQTDDHPVLNVAWDDAVAFCEWLSRQENVRYRLPSEAEWEYACRAATTTRYFNGNDPAKLDRQVARLLNTGKNGKEFSHVQQQVHWLKPGESLTAKVGSLQPNPWGLYDMLGNVWEWTGDWYGEDYYAQSPKRDPRGPADGEVRVRRGGAWNSFPLYARVSYRNWNSPDTRCVNVGFRVVREE